MMTSNFSPSSLAWQHKLSKTLSSTRPYATPIAALSPPFGEPKSFNRKKEGANCALLPHLHTILSSSLYSRKHFIYVITSIHQCYTLQNNLYTCILLYRHLVEGWNLISHRDSHPCH